MDSSFNFLSDSLISWNSSIELNIYVFFIIVIIVIIIVIIVIIVVIIVIVVIVVIFVIFNLFYLKNIYIYTFIYFI